MPEFARGVTKAIMGKLRSGMDCFGMISFAVLSIRVFRPWNWINFHWTDVDNIWYINVTNPDADGPVESLPIS